MTTYEYKLNAGQYVLHCDGVPSGPVMDEVAIALDVESGTRHKIGDPKMVADWVLQAKQKLRAAGADEMANQLTVISGRFSLEDLNRCWSTSSYALTLYRKVMAGTADFIDLRGQLVSGAAREQAIETFSGVEYGVNVIRPNGVGENPFERNFASQEEAEAAGRQFLKENPTEMKVVVFELVIEDNEIVTDATLNTLYQEDI